MIIIIIIKVPFCLTLHSSIKCSEKSGGPKVIGTLYINIYTSLNSNDLNRELRVIPNYLEAFGHCIRRATILHHLTHTLICPFNQSLICLIFVLHTVCLLNVYGIRFHSCICICGGCEYIEEGVVPTQSYHIEVHLIKICCWYFITTTEFVCSVVDKQQE